jgi:site-specific DNA-methyltransferase (adenine-specific)
MMARRLLLEPYLPCPGVELYHGDCLWVVPSIRGAFDAVVTDPPYGIGFMGRDWDRGVPGERFWRAILAATKPGGHLLAFGGTRTFHRLVCAVEDAGWEVRDVVCWLYGTGFPKSLDISKAIDKRLGAEREVLALGPSRASNLGPNGYAKRTPTEVTAAATPESARWQGWGTSLKPAREDVVLARRPLEGTVAENVLRHGTGGLNVGACRIGTETIRVDGAGNPWTAAGRTGRPSTPFEREGRWPANVAHDGSEEVLAGFPETSSGSRKAGDYRIGGGHETYGRFDKRPMREVVGDSGSAARFFYCSKVSRKERGPGNDHPTVKPQALLRWLLRLVTPPGGRILDPFAGSGSTLLAARAEGFKSVGVEIERKYCWIAARRLRRKG